MVVGDTNWKTLTKCCLRSDLKTDQYNDFRLLSVNYEKG